MTLNSDQVQKIKAKLPKAWSTTLSEKTGHCPDMVIKTINGKRDNDMIIKAALELIEETGKLEEAINLKIESL